MPVIILAGDEDFLVSRRAAELKAQLVDADWLSFNFACLVSCDLPAIIDAAATLPFGPGNRLVLVDRCDLFTKKRGKNSADSEKMSEKSAKALLEHFDKALATVADNTYLVFACPYNFDSTLKVSKIAEKHARIEAFPRERYYVGSTNPKLETWCRKEAHRWGTTIDDQAIAYLLDSTEADLRQIAAEIEKAAVYLLPDKHITMNVVANLSPHHSHVFSLLEQWAQGKRQEALTSLDELLSRGSGIPIIAAMGTTLSKWLNLKAAADELNASLPGGAGIKRRELPLPDIARKIAPQFGLKPYSVEMDLKRIQRLSSLQLADRKMRLTALENMVKTGQISDSHALTLFISN